MVWSIINAFERCSSARLTRKASDALHVIEMRILTAIDPVKDADAVLHTTERIGEVEVARKRCFQT